MQAPSASKTVRQQDIILIEADDRADNLDAPGPELLDEPVVVRRCLVPAHHRGRDPFGRPWELVPVEATEQIRCISDATSSATGNGRWFKARPGTLIVTPRNLRATRFGTRRERGPHRPLANWLATLELSLWAPRPGPTANPA